MAVGAMLSCTLVAQGAPQKISRQNYAAPAGENAAGQAPNAGSIDDDCSAGGFNLGTVGRFQSVAADTSGLNNDFSEQLDCAPAPCGYYTSGGGASDGIATFQVPVSGTWSFASCGGVVYDSAMAIREGGACPGTNCVSQDDDSCAGCAGPYEARITTSLTAGNTYYLILDGWSGGGNVDLLITGPCAGPADCQDGIFCNGAEVCTAGMCAAGTNPCTGSTPFCNEAADVCFGCVTDADCEDNIFCNGDSACIAGTCSPQSGNPCSAVQVCNEGTDACDNLDPCQTYRTSDFTLPGNFFPQCTNSNCNTSPTNEYAYGDDIELAKHSSRLVESYQFYTQGRPTSTLGATCNNNGSGTILAANLNDPYIVNSALYTVDPGTCLPGALIPGSECSNSPGVITAAGTNAQVFTCTLGTPVLVPDGSDDQVCFGQCSDDLAPCTADAQCNLGATCDGPNLGVACLTDGDCGGVSVCLDTNLSQCGVDFYIMMSSNIDSVGIGIGCAPLIGGPGVQDELADHAMVFAEFVAGSNSCTRTAAGWRFALAGPGGACTPGENRGNWRGEIVCTTPTGACCNSTDGTCGVETADDCAAAGGTYLGDIQVDGAGGCDDGVDTDGDGSRDECDLCDNDATKTAPGQCGCGIADTDTDNDGTANCNDGCPNDPAKIAPGAYGCGNSDQDTDGDGTADCQDGCPDDPNKTDPGICGCGVAETGDSDGDGVSDCVDVCPGVDDSVFAPGCVGAIPTVSEWGMVVLALLLLAGAKVYFGRRPVQA